MFPVPQKYYAPQRIRAGYHSKLDAAGLWNSLVEEKPEDKPFQKEKIKSHEPLKANAAVSQAFEKEKVRIFAAITWELCSHFFRFSKK